MRYKEFGLLVMMLFLLALIISQANRRSSAADPVPETPQTVTAYVVGQTGTVGKAGHSVTARIRYWGVEYCADPSLLGEHGGVNYFLYPEPSKHLNFGFSDELQGWLSQLRAANPTLTASDIVEEKCWGGFATSPDCTGVAPRLRPKLDCPSDIVSDPTASDVFEYRLTILKDYTPVGSMPEKFEGIKVTFR